MGSLTGGAPMGDCVCLPGLCTCPPADSPVVVDRRHDLEGIDPLPYRWAEYGRPDRHFAGTVEEWDELLAGARWLALWNADCRAAAELNPALRGTTRARKGTLRKATW